MIHGQPSFASPARPRVPCDPTEIPGAVEGDGEAARSELGLAARRNHSRYFSVGSINGNGAFDFLSFP
jgi:hypothetical protein